MRFCVLSVDEVGITRIELSNYLRNMDIEVISARDEIEASNLLYSKKSKIDIVVWTLNSIDDSEFELIKKVKNKETCKSIPFVIISKYTGKRYIIKAIQAGAAEYIAKPYDENTIVNKFANLLGIPLDREQNIKFEDDIISFSFSEMLTREIKAASRGSYPMSIMLASVAGNSPEYDESSSAEIIDIINRVIKTKLRDTDSVFLYGINNLVILLPFTNKEGIEIVKDKIRQVFKTNSVINSKNKGYGLLLSGVSFPEDGRIKKKLLEKLEENLNQLSRLKVGI